MSLQNPSLLWRRAPGNRDIIRQKGYAGDVEVAERKKLLYDKLIMALCLHF